MDEVYFPCAGLDVHKKTVTACRILGSGPQRRQEIRTFSTHTRDLLALRDWLEAGGCTHVALESTGVYWQPVYNVLEGSAELLLVNAKHVKNVPGRKTDQKDAEWLAELLRHGLLRASFVPPQPQRDLRDLTRGRALLIRERVSVVNRLQKGLEGANLKLGNVASDVVGVSGRDMLAAILRGVEAPEELAALARGRLKEKQAELILALEGRVRPHHLRKALAQAAHGAKIKKGSYYGALYQRLAGRRGAKKAIVAVGHALLVTIYYMLRYHEEYRELGRDYYDTQRKEGLVERLVKRIEKLGYQATVALRSQPVAE